MFLGGTPLPLPLVSAVLEALALLKQAKGRFQRRLAGNADFVKTGLRVAGCVLPEYPGPVISLTPASAADAAQLRRRLLQAGIYPSFIKYHGGPRDGYFRFVISSEHKRKQLRCLVKALTSWPGLAYAA